MKRDIYKRKEIFELEKKRLEKANISQRNKDLIIAFQGYLFSKGSGNIRVAKLSTQMRKICVLIGMDLDVLKREDILQLVAKINQNTKHSEATKGDYRRVVKQFYTFYKDLDQRLESSDKEVFSAANKMYKFVEKEISSSYKRKQIDPSEVITEQDIDLVIRKGCRTPKERAFIKFLHEGGLRIGEMLGIKRKDIIIGEQYGVAHINGKTGRRATNFVRSIPYIVQWLDIHPDKSPEAYVWLSERPNKMYTPLNYTGASKLMRRCFARAGLKKRNNLHWCRHSRASLLLGKIPEAVVCRYLGWTQGSRQVRTYSHLSNEQTRDAILKFNGLSNKEKEVKNQPKVCSCKAINDFSARYCYRCGKPLSVDILLKDQQIVKDETNKTLKAMVEMFQKPEVLKAFLDFKAKNET